MKLVFSADVDRTVNERYENNNEIEIPVTIHCPNGKFYLYGLFTLPVPVPGQRPELGPEKGQEPETVACIHCQDGFWYRLKFELQTQWPHYIMQGVHIAQSEIRIPMRTRILNHYPFLGQLSTPY